MSSVMMRTGFVTYNFGMAAALARRLPKVSLMRRFSSSSPQIEKEVQHGTWEDVDWEERRMSHGPFFELWRETFSRYELGLSPADEPPATMWNFRGWEGRPYELGGIRQQRPSNKVCHHHPPPKLKSQFQ
jgi:hypothetical protein